jgi:hypothetical protein
MKEINLKLETKTIECEVFQIKTAITVEEGTPEIVIPKKIRKQVEKLLIDELKNSKPGSFPYSIYEEELNKIKQLPQTQTSLMKQCEILRIFANKLGLYDAADFLRNDR